MSSSSDSHDGISTLNPFKAYAAFLNANASRVSSLESSLRSLTWFVPPQSLSSEALYTGLNILGMAHDTILSSSSSSSSSSSPPSTSSNGVSSSSTGGSNTATHLVMPVSAHTRFTKWFCTQSKLYKTAARLLSIVIYMQLLVEMAAKKYKGEKGRWRAVIGLEGIKAVLRLILLRLTAQRTVLQPSIPERSTDPSLLAATEAKSPSEERVSDTWKATRTGLQIPTISSLRADGASGMRSVEAEISAFLQTKVLTIDNVRKPYDLVRQRKGLGAFAEVVWILRPLIYVLALKKYGKRSLYPFLLSLSLEYFSYKNMADAIAATRSTTSEVERQELSKRRKAFWLYFLRGPVWYGWTRLRLEGFAKKFENIFGLNLLANIADDYKNLIDEYHYYSNS
ncbi:peroxisome membrane protein [Cystobasidium minutum MCA 4210]|uniref:peroxisome membrane protein n=1 Tax=Cystobasidium minutum MCA 4210 TaxID=1397322 RepID=UPI0034CFE4A8|eukprot:jgi/Rhomi1/186965/estExt_fgenesh1_pg.C_1_t10216